jgi:hypothetical protein
VQWYRRAFRCFTGGASVRPQIVEISRRKTLLRALLLGYLALVAFVPQSKAQRASAMPIRVESEQVLVPVFVWDARRWTEVLRANPSDPAAYRDIPIANLSIKDFQIYEDGREQTIDSVRPEEPSFQLVRDNEAQHYEYVTAAGRWVYPDIAPAEKRFAAMTWPTYLIAYTPPPSADGSCHQLSVRIGNHPDAAAFVREKYCKTKASATDPLRGTKFGQQMESDLASGTKGRIELSLKAITSFLDTNRTRVHLAVEFDAKKLRYQLKYRGIGELEETIGMLARVFAKDGTTVARLSDFDCCDYDDGAGLDWLIVRNSTNNILFAPRRYETQVYLPAGEYDFQVIVSDGRTFGRAEMPLVIESQEQDLRLGSLCVAHRARETRHELAEVATKQVGSYVPLVSKHLEITPAVNASFERNEPLYYYFEVYEPGASGLTGCAIDTPCEASVEAHVRVVNAKTGAVKLDQERIGVLPYASPGEPVIPVAGRIDVHSFRKGLYRLEVQATDAAGQVTPWHATPFRID